MLIHKSGTEHEMATLGKFVWYDLNTTDIAGAVAFYGDVADYKTQEWPTGDDQPYTMFAVGEDPIGGLMSLPDEAREAGAPSHWVAYISTSDTDETVRSAVQLGGTCLFGPMDIPEVGRFAVVQDPQGAVFSPFTPLSDGDREAPRGPGYISWHELSTSDIDAALAFYAELFGWKNTQSLEGDGWRYEIFGREGKEHGGIGPVPPGMQTSFWLMYITTDDLDAALERVIANGGQILNGPMPVPGGARVAQCLDPQGAAFGLTTSLEN